MLILIIDQEKLLKYMKEANIVDMYEKFVQKGINSEDLWFIPDNILLKDPSLSPQEKLKYHTMRAEHFKGKNDNDMKRIAT